MFAWTCFSALITLRISSNEVTKEDGSSPSRSGFLSSSSNILPVSSGAGCNCLVGGSFHFMRPSVCAHAGSWPRASNAELVGFTGFSQSSTLLLLQCSLRVSHKETLQSPIWLLFILLSYLFHIDLIIQNTHSRCLYRRCSGVLTG